MAWFGTATPGSPVACRLLPISYDTYDTFPSEGVTAVISCDLPLVESTEQTTEQSRVRAHRSPTRTRRRRPTTSFRTDL